MSKPLAPVGTATGWLVATPLVRIIPRAKQSSPIIETMSVRVAEGLPAEFEAEIVAADSNDR
jgi:hypothetical protein